MFANMGKYNWFPFRVYDCYSSSSSKFGRARILEICIYICILTLFGLVTTRHRGSRKSSRSPRFTGRNNSIFAATERHMES